MTQQNALSDEVQNHTQALIEALSAGKRVDNETRKRIHARADQVRDQLKQRHGEADLAVELIRQSRDHA